MIDAAAEEPPACRPTRRSATAHDLEVCLEEESADSERKQIASLCCLIRSKYLRCNVVCIMKLHSHIHHHFVVPPPGDSHVTYRARSLQWADFRHDASGNYIGIRKRIVWAEAFDSIMNTGLCINKIDAA